MNLHLHRCDKQKSCIFCLLYYLSFILHRLLSSFSFFSIFSVLSIFPTSFPVKLTYYIPQRRISTTSAQQFRTVYNVFRRFNDSIWSGMQHFSETAVALVLLFVRLYEVFLSQPFIFSLLNRLLNIPRLGARRNVGATSDGALICTNFLYRMIFHFCNNWNLAACTSLH